MTLYVEERIDLDRLSLYLPLMMIALVTPVALALLTPGGWIVLVTLAVVLAVLFGLHRIFYSVSRVVTVSSAHTTTCSLFSTEAVEGLEKVAHHISWHKIADMARDDVYRPLVDEALSLLTMTDNPDTMPAVCDTVDLLHDKFSKRQKALRGPDFRDELDNLVERA